MQPDLGAIAHREVVLGPLAGPGVEEVVGLDITAELVGLEIEDFGAVVPAIERVVGDEDEVKRIAQASPDRVLAGMFASVADLTRPGAVAERVAVLDGLWGTRLFMESGAADRIVANLERNVATLVAKLSALGPDALELEPERVIEAAQGAMPTILNHTVNGEVRFRENYSFATKFFHWCTRVHFPIVDSKARRKINSMQVAAGVRPRIRSDTAAMNGLTYLKEYERWIVFYAEVIVGLAAPERELLCPRTTTLSRRTAALSTACSESWTRCSTFRAGAVAWAASRNEPKPTEANGDIWLRPTRANDEITSGSEAGRDSETLRR